MTQKNKVERRNDAFIERQITKIWQEEPNSDNPYLTERSYCHGYETTELMKKRSFVDVFFLLFNAKLPTPDQANLLEQLMIALINPGPRHPATRAAMNASISKTMTTHILPVSLTILSGSHLGAGEIEASMRFLRKNCNKDPYVVAESLLESFERTEGDCHLEPGFGNHYSSIDPVAQRIADHLCSLNGAGKSLVWGNRFATALASNSMGWLTTGLAAAVFSDLGFRPAYGAGLFQLLCAPGLLAHGMEMANQPLTAMPFLKDEDYIIEE